ncbi:flagellar biosynthesis protein FlhA [Sulfitobacter aestuarii]|uniref:Flagellar biosynthesis protein FlhA n=1 Tax=Sulfitobacter aestuarii TaxID=2161676 RepID=A0ABW5U119_9RHOB
MSSMSNRKTAAIDGASEWLAPFAKNRDISFALAICVVLAILFVPLPPLLLDFGLSLSIAVSILVLMVALWVDKPLEFSSFPTLLLIVTMLRLSLNVASSRLILSEGQTGTDAAGNVIRGIADFVVSGDYVIGAVIFCILVTINFIVITKGSTRIAEVTARFSLDAMPGKQMAIDADLGAGMIDEEEARRRRKEVEGESSFFGAMDGAAKFVRGDAVAGIIITLINVLGGVLIGTMRHGMSITDALHNFTILTIGDGLVTQIPALIVSIAAGMIVTKGASEGASSDAITKQLGASPKALLVSAALVGGMGLLPGFPHLLFFCVAAALAGLGLMLGRNAEKLAEEERAAAQSKPAETAEDPMDMMNIDTIRLEMGTGLIILLNDAEATLPGKVKSLRNMFMTDYGFVLPPVRIKDSETAGPTQYRICVQGVEVATGELRPNARLMIDPAEEAVGIPGERVKEPTFGLNALWIDRASVADAEAAGFTVVDPESVIVTHLTDVLKEHMPDMLTYEATQTLLKRLSPDYRKLVSDIANASPVILLQHVLQKLLSERVSVRNLPLIVEALAEAAAVSKNATTITEHVRRKLAAQICGALEDSDRYIAVSTLGQRWEGEFAAAVKVQGDETICTMSPSKVQDFIKEARVELQKLSAREEQVALLVSPEFRPIIRSMLERVAPQTPVISHSEIHRKARLKTLSTIGT